MNILHLEDSDNDAELVYEMLGQELPDPCVTRVETRAKFIEALGEAPDGADWDVILSDYSLPGFDGISALKLASERRPEIPFIFVTGALGEERAVETLRCGATDYIVKSRLDLLGQVVRRAVLESENTRARKAAERNLETSLREKELLLKEVHHRVGNNLQIICSLLNMQADTLNDPTLAAALEESYRRVQSMAKIHRMLYASGNLKEIDFAEYAESLAWEVSRSYGRDTSLIQLTFRLESIYLALDLAIPCGLILNELLSNSFKHAFPNGKSGEISVSLGRQRGSIRLAVEDTGIGLPASRAPEERQSLGMTIIETLTLQLEGNMEITSDHGSHFVLTLPLRVP